jgi:TonB family protein
MRNTSVRSYEKWMLSCMGCFKRNKMKIYLFYFVFLSFSFSSYSQSPVKDTTFYLNGDSLKCKVSNDPRSDHIFFDKVEFAPSYPGGENRWNNFIKENIRYPQQAVWKGTKGIVRIAFIIRRNGETTDFSILKPQENGLSEEGIRLVVLSGKWFPAIQNGYCVNAYFNIPIEFK